MTGKQIYNEDLAYIHHTGFGEFARRAAPELLKILKRHRIKKGALLDLGCGSGIWAREAERAGFSVIGIDQSPAMIALARATSPRSEFRCASLHHAKLPRCDVITAVGEPLNYITAGRSLPLVAFFKRLATALRPSGLLIFDVIIAEGTSLANRIWKAGKDWAMLTETIESPSRRLLKRHMTTFRAINGLYRRRSETHEVRLFPCSEIQRSLRRAGFSFESKKSYGKFPLLRRRRAYFCQRQQRETAAGG